MHLVLYFYHNLYLCERDSILETMKTEIIHKKKSSMVQRVQYILIKYLLLQRVTLQWILKIIINEENEI